jgi:hypothetical protein
VSSRGSKKKNFKALRPHEVMEEPVMVAKEIIVDLWKLEAPELVYHADNCAFETISGAPTMYFFQIGPGGNWLNAIALGFTRQAFERAKDSLKSIKNNLEESARTIYASDSIETLDLKSLTTTITNDNFRKDSAQFIRAACSDDQAYIDFYNIPPLVKQQGINRETLISSIHPIIRVYLTPILLLYLLNIINREETIGDA